MKRMRNILLSLSALGMALCSCGPTIEPSNSYADDARYQIYQLAVADGYQGTYEEWLASIRGKDGRDGKDGLDGRDGVDGHSPVITIGEDGYWYIDGVNAGVKAEGRDGLDGHDGADGRNGVDGRNGSDGRDGIDGRDGVDGKDGASLLTGHGAPSDDFGKQGDCYIDSDTWDYYVRTTSGWVLSGNIKGAAGEQGPKGQDGQDGKDGRDGIDGQDGRSAYDIYVEAHPDYEGDEAQWLSDLLNGRLADKTYCTVSFDSNGGKTIPSQLVLKGEKAQDPGIPTKNGYFFDGWTYGGKEWSFVGYVVTEDMTLTAEWSKGIGVYYYDDWPSNGGEIIYSTKIREGEEPHCPVPIPEKESSDGKQYCFVGWKNDSWSPDSFVFYPIYEEMDEGLTIVDGVVTKYNGTNTVVEIPSSWNGHPVTKIGQFAFNNSACEEIILPDTLTTLDDSAFSGAINLKSIVIPDSVTSIGGACFARCNALESVVFGTGLTTLSGELFAGVQILPSVTFKGKIDDFDKAFGYFTHVFVADFYVHCSMQEWLDMSLYFPRNHAETRIHLFLDGTDNETTSLTFPNGITEIKRQYLANCAVKSVFIPWSVETFENSVFDGARELEKIVVAAENDFYSSRNGVLYNKAQTSIIAIPVLCKGKIYLPNTYFSLGTVRGLKNATSFEIEGDNPNYAIYNGVLYNKDLTTLLAVPGDIHISDFWSPSVTKVGSYAFMNSASLSTVTIPSGVLMLDQYAFAGTLGIQTVIVPESVIDISYRCFYWEYSSISSIQMAHNPDRKHNPGAFYGLPEDYPYLVEGNGKYLGTDVNPYLFLVKGTEEAVDVTVHDGCGYIGDYSFAGNKTLQSITLSSSCKAIGNCAFSNCSALSSVAMNEGLLAIFTYAFDSCASLQSVTLPDTLFDLETRAFNNCTSLANVEFGSGLTDIYDAFNGCTGLEEITIPGTVEIVDYNAFAYCSGLKTVNIEEGVKNVCLQAFMNCGSLTTVHIPSTVDYIDSSAFRACYSLQTVDIDEDNLHYVFDANAIYSKDKTTLIMVMKGFSGIFVIPDSVTVVSYECFATCDDLTGIVVPVNVTEFKSSIGLDLDAIYYEGTKEQFDLIVGAQFVRRYNDDELLYYSESSPSGEGSYWHYVDGVPTPW